MDRSFDAPICLSEMDREQLASIYFSKLIGFLELSICFFGMILSCEFYM
ncbi:hypothetical protein J2S17_002071 [Cytobacillus purgationiresistens]|uniref:Uncharacterized protein n=1 Tax=Cytobacillus purgationiresistens TaxID=863449 RepID=A0ABU0AG10_9BACI|nr:hypothetical protein [Cytobacillus purgationiresistens]